MPTTSPLKVQPADSRSFPRRILRFRAVGKGESAELQLQLYNLSHTGFLAKVTSDLEIGQVLEIELPLGGSRSAQAVWLDDGLAGFTFLEPISSAAMSSAFLKGDYTPAAKNAEPVRERDLSDEIGYPWGEISSPETYSRRTRLLILLGLTAVSWAAIIGAVMLLL